MRATVAAIAAIVAALIVAAAPGRAQFGDAAGMFAGTPPPPPASVWTHVAWTLPAPSLSGVYSLVATRSSGTVASGDCLVAAIFHSSGTAISSVTLNDAGSTAFSATDQNAPGDVDTYTLVNAPGGGDTVTASLVSGSGGYYIMLDEYHNAHGDCNAVDKHSISTASSSGSLSSGSVTTTTDDVVWGVAVSVGAGDSCYTPGTSPAFTGREGSNHAYTAISAYSGTYCYDVVTEDYAQSGAGSIAATFTQSLTESTYVALVAFSHL